MKVMRCKESFRVGGKSGPSGLNEGDLVPENHPLVKQSPKHFEAVEDHVARAYPALAKGGGVEQATAAPGEKRSVAADIKQDKPARRRSGKPGKQDSTTAPSSQSAATDAGATGKEGAS